MSEIMEMKPLVPSYATHREHEVRLTIEGQTWTMDPKTASGLARELEVCARAAADYRREHGWVGYADE